MKYIKNSYIPYIIGIFLFFFTFSEISIAAKYGDVPDTHANNTAIEYLTEINVFQGYSDGSFRPDDTINRAEILKILIAAQNINPDANQYKNCFPDVNTEWFAKYLCYAKERNWVEGYPDGNFRPAEEVNKVEAVKMLIHSFGFENELPENVDEQLFNDIDNEAWYAPYLYIAKNKNLLEETENTFSPANGMTRAGAAEEIFRTIVIKNTKEEQYSNEARDSFLQNKVPNNQNDTIQKLEMTAGNFYYDANTITAKPGQTIEITFTQIEGYHDFTIDEINFNEILTENQTINFTAPQQPGEYAYYCSIGNHRAMGMEGILTVEE